MTADLDFASFEADPALGEPDPAPAPAPDPAPAFSIDDLAPADIEDLPAPDPEKEELRRRVAEFERRPAPSAFDAPAPTPPENPRDKLRAEFLKKLQSGDENAVADAFVMAAEMGAAGAEERLRGQLEQSQGSMIDRTIDRFVSSQKDANPQLWKAISKDFNKFMDEARKRIANTPGAASRLNEAMVTEACEDFYERSKGRALDRYIEKANAAKRVTQTPPGRPDVEPVPDYNPLSAPKDNGKSGPLVGKTAAEKRTIADGRMAGLTDDEIRDIL